MNRFATFLVLAVSIFQDLAICSEVCKSICQETQNTSTQAIGKCISSDRAGPSLPETTYVAEDASLILFFPILAGNKYQVAQTSLTDPTPFHNI